MSRRLGSVFGSRLCRRRNVQLQPSRLMNYRVVGDRPPRIVGYYVVYPVIPEDTPQSNKFLAAVSKGDWPPFQSATDKEFFDGFIKLALDYGATIFEHNDVLQDQSLEKTFSTVVKPLLKEEYNVNYALNSLLQKMLTNWSDNDRKQFKSDMFHAQGTYVRNVNGKYTSANLYKALKELYADRANLNQWQLRLIEFYMKELKMHGSDFESTKQLELLSAYRARADEFRSKYHLHISTTHDTKVITIDQQNAHLIKDAPDHVLRALAANPETPRVGPWSMRLYMTTYLPFMRYCKDRGMRQDAFHHWTSRASFMHDYYNNSPVIEEIRHYKECEAKTLGFESPAEMYLQNKMAGSPETVRNFLIALKNRMKPAFNDRLVELQDYAKKQEMFGDQLKPHDLYYYSRKEAEDKYDIRPLELLNYFPTWPTFDNIVLLFSRLFGLKFQEITQSNLERCSPDVRIFAVTDAANGEHLGRLYVDMFVRKRKEDRWATILGRTAHDERGLDKIVFLNGTASPPTKDHPSLLHYEELQSLLQEFGRAVQLLVSRSPYADLTVPRYGMIITDWDALDAFPTFSRMLVHKASALDEISPGHYATGERLSKSRLEDVGTALSRAALWESYRTLFWSDYDLTMYSMKDRKEKFWLDLYKEMWKAYFPFGLGGKDNAPCSFTPIFTAAHSSLFYSKLWVEMLALDMHGAFNMEDSEQATGQRLKDTILAPGASENQSELFRRFRGRDPSTDPICEFYDPPNEFDEPNSDDED